MNLKNYFTIILCCLPAFVLAQNISVDSNSYTPQELVENILINSGCIGDVTVTNTVSGDFNNEKSFGYFSGNGSNFPFQEGIVMSTGRLSNVPGPNNSLSDDDAPGWGSDPDLEDILGESNTTNATVIEFDFTPNANSIQFRYIFASEEYQEGDQNTCVYSDLFGFLIKPLGDEYENIAVVPDTNIPVKVTTVHPEIPGGCAAENEAYFGSFNGTDHPINFNGQTKALTAQADVVPNTTYHIKLIVADEQNYRYDSAVFLEGSSFNIGANLGPNLVGQDALCQGETYQLNVGDNGLTPQNYTWILVEENGSEQVLVENPTQDSYTVNSPGTYKVEVDYGNNCIATDFVVIEYVDLSYLSNESLSVCDANNDGLSVFNLNQSIGNLVDNQQNLTVSNFFLTAEDAENNVVANAISNPQSFENTEPNQIIYARIESQTGCFRVLEIQLSTNFSNYNPVYLVSCSTDPTNVAFIFEDANALIAEEIGTNAFSAVFYATAEEAASQENPLPETLNLPETELPKSIFARLQNSSGCVGIIEVILQNIEPPQLDANYQTPQFCGSETNNLTLEAGVVENLSSYSYEWNTGETTPSISIDSTGIYEVAITNTKIMNGNTYTCTLNNSFQIESSGAATIDYSLSGNFDNYTIEVLAEGLGNYVYALDNANGPFQENNIFNNLKGGEHIIYVKDLNGCGTVLKKIYLLDYMQFFTPNFDGYNDYWQLKNPNNVQTDVRNIYIFDRYGKLLTSISASGKWDGTYHGKNMPSNDYWFKIVLKSGQELKGHFTLKR